MDLMKGGAFTNGISALIKQELSLAPFTRRRQRRCQALPMCWCLDLGLPISSHQNGEKWAFVFHKPPSLCYSVLAAPKDQDASFSSGLINIHMQYIGFWCLNLKWELGSIHKYILNKIIEIIILWIILWLPKYLFIEYLLKLHAF